MEPAPAKSFEDLVDVAEEPRTELRTYRLTASFPSTRSTVSSAQMRRAAVSVLGQHCGGVLEARQSRKKRDA